MGIKVITCDTELYIPLIKVMFKYNIEFIQRLHRYLYLHFRNSNLPYSNIYVYLEVPGKANFHKGQI